MWIEKCVFAGRLGLKSVFSRDYKRHVAISRLVSTEDYGIHEGYVLSNAREVERSGGIVYMPIYYSMLFDNRLTRRGPVYI